MLSALILMSMSESEFSSNSDLQSNFYYHFLICQHKDTELQRKIEKFSVTLCFCVDIVIGAQTISMFMAKKLRVLLLDKQKKCYFCIL